MSDRSNRSATPLIDVRTCQRQARAPLDGAGQIVPDDPTRAMERVPKTDGGAPNQQPAAEPQDRAAMRQSARSTASDEPEIDIVDFQSMQSFPASDSPAWPAVESTLDVTPARPANEQGSA